MSADRAKGFSAFPKQGRGRGRFATSWWGNAWIRGMEETSLDQQQLLQGRKYAYGGHVGPITLSPGRIAAPVYGNDDFPFDTVVFVPQLTEAEWGRFLDQVAARAGHIAALLDNDMPYDLVEAAGDAGVRLLPEMGDMEPECSCPDWELPCRHAAALFYQASWLLDEDPFLLLLIKGRGERELLDELQRRNGQQLERKTPVIEVVGTTAATAYTRELAPLPALPPVSYGTPFAVDPPPGLDPDALAVLGANAVARARELLDDLAPALDTWQDAVRMAAADPRLTARLRPKSGRPKDFPRAVRAWEYGGPGALEAFDSAWSPAKPEIARANTALAAEDLPALTVSRNRWTGDGVQLRYGRDGRWYPYREEGGEWWPAGLPARDPVTALLAL